MTDQPTGPRSFRFRALWLLLIAAVLMALPALKGGLLNYDDRALIDGPGGAFARSPVSFFTGTYHYAYLPFYGLSYWVDGKLGGSPLLLHAGNVIFHAATCYLVFCVLALLLRHRVGALFGALVFAVHPLHVESVAWIAGRKDVLSAFLLFLAWLLHLRERRGWALAVFLAACFAKASAVVLPLLLLGAALLLPLYRDDRRRAARATMPFFAAALVPVLVHLLVGVQRGVIRAPDDLSLRLLAGIAAWGRSVVHTLLPLDLSIDYPEGRVEGLGAAMVPLLVLSGVAAMAVILVRRAPAAAFGIFAFFAALLPFNNVFPATDVYMADRYLYLSLFGLAALVAWAVERWQNGALVAGLASVVLVGLSFTGATRFVSDEVLWTRTIASRDASTLAYFNRGQAREERALRATPQDLELLKQATADFEAALQRAVLDEHEAKANAALVVPLLMLRQPTDALERAGEALALVAELDTDGVGRFRAEVLYSRGLASTSLRDHRGAARDFAESAKLWPRYPAFFEHGRASLRLGRLAEARKAFGRAADLDTASPVPSLQLARVERLAQKRPAYRRALQEASRRAPGDPEVVEGWVNFWLDGRAPDYVKARKELDRLETGSSDRRKLEAAVEAERALYLFRRGETKEAVEAADRARELGLARSPTQYELGQIYMDAGRYDDAVQSFRAAADALGGARPHKDAVARAYALKAYRLLAGGAEIPAKRAMRAAVDARPGLLEAGAAPLRAEVGELRGVKNDDLLLLAAAAVAGDPARAEVIAARILTASPVDTDRILTYRLRALSRAFGSYEFGDAKDDLAKVLEHDPKDVWARFRLAQVRGREGVGWLRTAEQAHSESRREQGEALLKSAIDLLDELVAENPGFHLARLQRGEVYFSLQDNVGAKADYAYVRKNAPHLRQVFVKEALLHRLEYVLGNDRTNLDVAIRYLTDVLAQDPNYFDALYELGNVYHLLYDAKRSSQRERKLAFHRAVLWYRRAMAINPRTRQPRLEWTRICLKAGSEALAGGHVRAAHELLERIEAEGEDYPAMFKLRVELNMRPDFGKKTGQAPDAIFTATERALEKLDAKDADRPRLVSLYHRKRGYSYYWTWVKLKDEKRKKRARELTIEQWSKALDAWPEDPDNISVRSRLREIAPEFIDPDRTLAESAYQRGMEALQKEEFKQAAAHFASAVRLFPEAVELRYAYATALLQARDLERAREEFIRVANHPEGDRFPEVLYELGKLFFVKKERLVARVWYERFVAAMDALGRGDEETAVRARQIIKELG